MYRVMTETVLSAEDQEKLAKGKPVEAGFDRKITIRQAFLEELKEADITKYDFIPYAEDILIVQGMKDEVLPVDEILAFSEEQIIECVAVENADHRFVDPDLMDQAIHEILEFLAL